MARPSTLRARWPSVDRDCAAGRTSVSRPPPTAASSGRRATFVALVNNDVELDPAFLRELVGALEADPGGSVGSGEDAAVRRARGDRRDRRHAALVRRGAAARPGRARPRAVRRARPRVQRLRGRGARTGARRSTRSGCSTRRSSPTSRTSTGASARSCRPRVRVRADSDRLPRRLGVDAARGQAGPVLLRPAASQRPLDGAQELPGERAAALRAARCSSTMRRCCFAAVRDGMARAHFSALWAAARGLPRVLRAAAGDPARAAGGRRELEPLITRGWRPR